MSSYSFSYFRLLALGFALFNVGCGSATPAPGTTTDAPASGVDAPADAKIRASIASFLANPVKGKDASAIVNFVGEDARVMVVYREAILSAEGSTSEVDRMMLVAFSAGNVRAQLDSGKKEDAPLAGVRAMIDVYAKLKEKDASLKIAKFEEYAAREEKGTLEAHVKGLTEK